MKVLVMGSGGMAGHVIRQHLLEQGFDVVATARGSNARRDKDAKVFDLDARDEFAVAQVVRGVRPDVIVNAIGMLPIACECSVRDAIAVNAMLPLTLASLADGLDAKLIHVSTDCVFSGSRGGYAEDDIADGDTVYARTKQLGEVNRRPHLTIRTSIVGPEIKPDGTGLFHWFMQQRGLIHGFRRVMWNGVTTMVLAQVIETCLHTDIHELVHLAGPERISKFAMLRAFQCEFWRDDVVIRPVDNVIADKSLVSTRDDFQPSVPSYDEMWHDMREWMAAHCGMYEGVYRVDGGH